MSSAKRTSLCAESVDDVAEESVCWYQDYEGFI